MTNIAVIGLGLMGGSLVKALKSSGGCYKIRAIEIKKENIESALMDGYIERGESDYSNIEEVFRWADIIMICLFPSDAVNLIKKYINLIDDKTILSDFCGVKKDLFEASINKRYVGLHVMAGKETGGYINSSESLFQNSNSIIVPNENAEEEDVKRIEKLSKDIGCAKTTISAADNHDEMIAFTSQLMHIIACGIVNHEKFLKSLGYEGNSLGDHTRVGTIDADMWSELFLYNSKYLSNTLSQYLDRLNDFKKALDDKNLEELKKLMRNSNSIKSVWLERKYNKGEKI